MVISAMVRGLAADPDTSDSLAFTGDEDVSFRALVDRGQAAAGLMRELGVRRGDVVGVVVYNESSLFAVLLGACSIGAAIVPISPRARASERDALLARTRATACWTRGAFDEPPPIPVLDVAQLAAARAQVDVVDEGRANDVCWVAATGGSTGEPKLYAVSQSNLLTNLLINTADWNLDRHGVHVSVAPLAHGIGFCNALVQLLHGGMVHLNARLSAARALEAIAQFPATWTALVPTLLYDLVEQQQTPLDGLELIVCAGSTLGARTRERVSRVFPAADVREYYGSTEMGWVTSHNSAEWRAAGGSVGRPTRGTRIRIVDEHGAEALPGEIGEIYAAGRPYAVGRIEDAPSKQTDWPDWISSGDRGYVDEHGRLHLVGRADDLIIVGGLNVDPVEIVTHLTDHPDVSAAVVEGVPDERLGSRIHAYIETGRTDAGFPDELAAFARIHMAAYKVPSSFELRASLPRSAAGKVSLAALRIDGSHP